MHGQWKQNYANQDKQYGAPDEPTNGATTDSRECTAGHSSNETRKEKSICAQHVCYNKERKQSLYPSTHE